MTVYYKMRQILLQNETAILLQNATEVYYKMRRVFYYKIRQLLHIATFITNCDSTLLLLSMMDEVYRQNFLLKPSNNFEVT